MSTYFLRFPDLATAISILRRWRRRNDETGQQEWGRVIFRTDADGECENHTPGARRFDIDIIGLNPRELDQSQGCYDAQGQPIWKQHSGVLVNLIGPRLPDGLAQYQVFPATPMRTFGP